MDLALRETWRGRVWRVIAYRLVEEQDGQLVLWSPPGATVLRPFDERGIELRIPGAAGWRLERRPTSEGSLGLVRPGSRFSLWHHWHDGGFSHWYVNFERDHVRRGFVLDHVDEKLDLVVDPDGGVRWKDEDELLQAIELGVFDDAGAADVRSVGERAVAERPWPTGWEDWRPDPAWTVPPLPDDWHVL